MRMKARGAPAAATPWMVGPDGDPVFATALGPVETVGVDVSPPPHPPSYNTSHASSKASAGGG